MLVAVDEIRRRAPAQRLRPGIALEHVVAGVEIAGGQGDHGLAGQAPGSSKNAMWRGVKADGAEKDIGTVRKKPNCVWVNCSSSPRSQCNLPLLQDAGCTR
ncbi:hypothetical protein ACFQOZ_07150 [Comamonas endophytica]